MVWLGLPLPLFATEIPNQYIIGVAVGFSCAFASGLSLVLSAKAKRCPNHILMIVVGFGTLLVGMIGPLLTLDNRFLKSINTWESSMKDISLTTDLSLTTFAGILSLLGAFVLIYASQIAPPTLISTIRSCEILLALLYEKVILIDVMKHGSEQRNSKMIWLVLGALLVLVSAILMTVSDWIEKFIISVMSDNEPKCITKKSIDDIISYESSTFLPTSENH